MMLLTFDPQRPKAQHRPQTEATESQTPAIVAIAWELHRLDSLEAQWAASFLRGLLGKMKAQPKGGR